MKAFLCTGVLLGAVIALIALWEWRAVGRLRANCRFVQEEQAGEAGRLAADEERLSEARRRVGEEVAQREKRLAAARHNPGVAPKNVVLLTENDPELQLLREKATQVAFFSRYEGLFRKLRLSSEQRARFAELFSRYETESNDIRAAARTAGLRWNDPVIEKEAKAAAEAYSRELDALLGPQGTREYQAYERTVAARELLVNLGGAATVAGVGFDAHQTDTLARLICEASEDYREGKAVNLTAVDWELVDAQAREILRPEQWTAFTTYENFGPGGSGGRHFYLLHGAVDAAWKAEKGAKPAGAPAR